MMNKRKCILGADYQLRFLVIASPLYAACFIMKLVSLRDIVNSRIVDKPISSLTRASLAQVNILSSGNPGVNFGDDGGITL